MGEGPISALFTIISIFDFRFRLCLDMPSGSWGDKTLLMGFRNMIRRASLACLLSQISIERRGSGFDNHMKWRGEERFRYIGGGVEEQKVPFFFFKVVVRTFSQTKSVCFHIFREEN